MYINETTAMKTAIVTIKKIIADEDICTVDGVNGVLLFLDALLGGVED